MMIYYMIFIVKLTALHSNYRCPSGNSSTLGTMEKRRANEIVRLVQTIPKRMPYTELMPWKDLKCSKNVSKADMDNKLMTLNDWIRLVHCLVTPGHGIPGKQMRLTKSICASRLKSISGIAIKYLFSWIRTNGPTCILWNYRCLL